MAFKFIVLCAFLAVASAGNLAGPLAYSAPALAYSAPAYAHAYAAPVAHTYAAPLTYAAPAAIGSTQQNVVRSFAGTVSQYSKAVDTPFSSVRKVDTRINNNVYTPAIAKTLAYAAPAPAVYASHATYAAPAPAVYSHAAPAVYSHAAPAVYSHAAPALYSHGAPALYSHAAPVTAYAAKAIAYSPAATVAHVSFDGFGAHYGY